MAYGRPVVVNVVFALLFARLGATILDKELLDRTNFWTYASLMLLTATAAIVVELSPAIALASDKIIESVVLVIAAAKILLVTEYFMELHQAPGWLRGSMIAWISFVVLILITLIFVQGI